MIGLDTNILIRLIVRDDARQTKAAEHILETGDQAFYINLVVLCETLWVLRSSYGFSKSQLLDVAAMLVQSEDYVVEQEKMMLEAIELAEKHGADIPDVLVSLLNHQAGCKHTLTFDDRAAKVKGLKRVGKMPRNG